MGFLGDIFSKPVGRALGTAAGGIFGNSKLGGDIGGEIGGAVSKFIPFSKGGMVKNKTQKALLHKGEMVVPAKMVKLVPKSLKTKIANNGGRNMKKTKK